MPGVDPVLPFTLNPNVKLTYEANCMKTIEGGVRQLLIDENGDFPLKNVNLRISYLFLAPENPEVENPNYPENHLSLSVVMSDADLADRLVALLNAHFQKYNAIDGAAPAYRHDDILEKNARPKNTRNKKDPMSACVVIPHAYVPRFLNEVCRAISLYARHQYSLVRDFYLVNPEGGRTTIANDDVVRGFLKKKYQALHRAYDLSEKMQSRSVSLAHYANGANAGASLFKKVHHSANTEEELYQRLNALVHAYQLGEVDTRVPDFVDKMTLENDRTRIVNTYSNNFLTIIRDSDMLYEISRRFKEDPEVKLAFVSPDNLFRAGSAALVGGRGTVEEMMARVTNYVPSVLAKAELHPSDPQGMLCALYAHLSPTGNTLVLGKASGAFHLEGLSIPEYIARKDVKAYSEFAYNALHLAREMEHANGYEDKYPAYKTQPRFVPDVKMLDAQGVVRSVGVMGMVGIDGRSRRSGSFAEKVGFADSDLQDKKGLNEQHEFDFDKTREFYRTQWIAAFEEVLKPGNRVDVFVLNPVGCGAFDPSPDGSTFTRASAEGFAAALAVKRAELEAANIKLVLPIYDMRKVYGHYYREINHAFHVVEPVSQCSGGSIEFCHAAIVKKYRELKGSQFDIEHKTLEDILAHALQKDRKTRAALVALNYLEVVGGLVRLSALAPQVIRDAYAEVSDELLSPLRIKERIIEAYKNVRGTFFYKRSEARREAFDIFSASLQAIFEHAEMKEGHTRQALQNLGYIKTELVDNCLVLCDGHHPEAITQAFEAMSQVRQQRAPMHP